MMISVFAVVCQPPDLDWSRNNGPTMAASGSTNLSPRSSLGAFQAAAAAGLPPLDELSSQQSPRDRDMAAARLRSILTSAMDASRITAAASEAGAPPRANVRLPASPAYVPDRRPPPVTRSVPPPWNKLPEMSLAGAAPATSTPSSVSEPRLLGRLAPLVQPPRAYMSHEPPRFESISGSVASPSNGMLSTFAGGAPRKAPSMFGNSK